MGRRDVLGYTNAAEILVESNIYAVDVGNMALELTFEVIHTSTNNQSSTKLFICTPHVMHVRSKRS